MESLKNQVKEMDNTYKLVCRDNHKEDTIIAVNGVEIGNGGFTIVAGPCAVENENQINTIAHEINQYGVQILRGGVFKPRTSPYDFQGLGTEGIKYLVNAKKRENMLCVTEITDASQLEILSDVDILQIGTKNMQNYSLLKEVGKINKPIILKRGFGCTIDELLYSAEYILVNGNKNVILCERGIRTYQQCTRYMLDISCIPILKQKTHLPVIVDPSHAAGRTDLVMLLSEVSMVAGADGIIVEVHNNPSEALCDGKQALDLEMFKLLVKRLRTRYNFEKYDLTIN